MNSTTLENLAETGTAQDVTDLLRATGDIQFGEPSPFGGLKKVNGTGADYIAIGVNRDKDTAQKEAKLRAVTNFLAKKGPFAEPQELPPSLTDQFQAAVAAIAELQEQVKEIPKLKAQIAKLQKKPGVKKSTAPDAL